MTQLLYQTDAYLQQFQAVVTAVDPAVRSVVLDQSAFILAEAASRVILEP